MSATEPEGALQTLLTYLRDARGFDFSGYKVPSLERRLRKRMDVVGVETYEEYRDYLEVHSGEFRELFNTILINVTAFFRDADAWAALRDDVLPALLQRKRPDEPLRVWSAGCSSGEEAYSISMLLAEALGTDEYLRRVKIYGTDVDDEALDAARQGAFDPARLADVDPALQERYFERAGEKLHFRKDLRRTIIFGRNDLVQDAPISRIDLLLCRNTLMYFTSETQGQVLRRLHFALQPTGFLFLGKSEMLLTRRATFEPIDLKRRIFTKIVQPGDRRYLPPITVAEHEGEVDGSPVLAARALDASPAPQIVVGRDRTLLVVNDAARRALRVGRPDIGRPVQDLEVSYRPVELRAALEGVFADGQPASLGPVDHRQDDRESTFEIRLVPLRSGGEVDAVSVTFVDVTGRHEAEQEADKARLELGAAYEELQSTNEELETMNEELQSTNEELETMNDELRVRSLELHESNVVMEAVLRVEGVGIVVLDQERRVRLWSTQSEDLWGLRSDEVLGERLMELDFGLPVEELRSALQEAVGETEPVTASLRARDRRGRDFECLVTVIPLRVEADQARAAATVLLTQRTA